MPFILPATNRDPLRTYQFRLSIPSDGGAPGDGGFPPFIAGVRSVSGLNFTIRPFEVYEGGNNLHRYAQPDKVTWDPVTLEQGLALGTKLSDWADAMTYYAQYGTVLAGQPVKRNVQISVFDESDVERIQYLLINAWISRYQSLPRLDAMSSSETGIQTIEFTHEGYKLINPVPLSG
jgi:phage tail-like protein